jgi:hypothetical protein
MQAAGRATDSSWKPGVTIRGQDLADRFSNTGDGRVTLGLIGPVDGDWTVTRGAGFNHTLESNVQRQMYPDNFNCAGSWKDSSFAKRGRASERPCHPSLWPVDDVRNHRTWVRQKGVTVGDFRRSAIPGYKGYIPGKKAESVFGETVRVANAVATGLTPVGAKTEVETAVPYVDLTQGIRSFKTCLDWPLPGKQSPLYPDMNNSVNYGPDRDAKLAKGYTSNTNMVKDHEIPPAMTRSFSSPCSLDSKAFPGYSGYIPQRLSEAAHLDWRTPQAAQVNDAVPNSYGRALAGWSPFVPGRVAETVHGHIGMANTWKSMATREYFDTYHAEKPQFPRGMSEPVPNPYVGPYEDLNLSKARQSGAPTMPSSGPTPRADHADDRPMMTLHTLY